MKVVYSNDAVRDYIQAIDWYEEQAPGLGDVFRRALLGVEQRIAAFPESAPVVEGEFRSCLIPRFPYQVVYCIEAEVLRIYAVFHCARDWTRTEGE
jgi:toxin ParE1/3/4